MKLLVLDAYAREGRNALARVGATEAGALYARMLRRIEPKAQVDVMYAADPDAALPSGVALGGYDGAAWTGSSLTIHAEGDARVTRQVELARALLAAKVPNFGSCWAAQLASIVGGGRCAESPRGREFGIARAIQVGPEGQAHPLYEGKPEQFDAFTSHGDEVATLATGSTLLASNDWSRVQAVDVRVDGVPFWAVQYHPEYDLHEVACLCILRKDELVAQGTFADGDVADAYVTDLEALHADPARADLQAKLQVSDDLLEPDRRQQEVRNWLDHQVRRR